MNGIVSSEASKLGPDHLVSMWSPANMASLPSQVELEQARVAIGEQETALEDARAALVRAEQRVAELEKDLKLRRAWIAPIRKLNFDALSQVLIFASQNDWKAPLRLGGVSRQWRHTALKTPSAWSLFDCPKKPKNELLDLYLQRSGSTPLHLYRWANPQSWVNDTTSTELLYRENSTRITCVKISRLEYLQNMGTLPSVELLDVDILMFIDAHPMPTLTKERFPSLRTLRVGLPKTSGGELSAEQMLISEQRLIERPEVNSLLIKEGSTASAGPVIRIFANSLTSLRLNRVEGTFQPFKICLPKLLHLSIVGDTHKMDSFLTTPALRSYEQCDCGWTDLQYSDLNMITCFRLYDRDWPHHYSLDHFPGRALRIIQTPQILLETAEALIRDTSAYPALLTIEVWNVVVEVSPEDDENYASLDGLCIVNNFRPRIAEANGARQTPVEIVITHGHNWSTFEDEQVVLVSLDVYYWAAFDGFQVQRTLLTILRTLSPGI